MTQAWLLALQPGSDPTALRALLDPRPEAEAALDQLVLAGQGDARAWLFEAGLPLSLPALGLDAPGLQALASAALAVASGHQDLVLAVACAGHRAPSVPWGPGRSWRSSAVSEEEAEALARTRGAVDPEALVAWERAQPAAAAPRSPGVLALLASDRFVRARGLHPQARISALAATAGDPAWRLLAPGRALAELLQRAGLQARALDRLLLIDVVAETALRTIAQLGLPPERVTADGAGALVDLLATLQDQGERLCACATGDRDGQGLALLIDRSPDAPPGE